MDDEDTRIPYRPFNGSTIRFQSKTQGKIIRSLRKFGIEVEMYNETTSHILKFASQISNLFGLEHDGSLDTPGHAVEVVSPILRGEAGENAVRDLFDNINEYDFKINSSCGFHVHLDGSDFSNKSKTYECSVGEITEEVVKKIKNGTQVVVVKDKLIKSLRGGEYPQYNDNELVEILLSESSRGDNYLFLSKALGYSVLDARKTESRISIGDTDIIVTLFTAEDENRDVAPEDRVFIIDGNNNLSNILTLLYLHTVYGDVFSSMLPKSRRQGNMYCQKLSTIFSPTQIENITSFTELERAWYGVSTSRDVGGHKSNKYDDSRYFSVNLHSLFSKYGTVEFRSHSPTLNSQKALYWIALNQKIMDNIADGRVTISSLRGAVSIFELDDKVDFMLGALDLGATLNEYVKSRIDYFSGNKK